MSLPAPETQKKQVMHPCQGFEGHTDEVHGVIHLPDGRRIITCSKDGSLRVWNLETGKQIGNEWRSGENAVYRMALSPSGKKVVSGGEGDVLKVWDIDTGKVITKLTGNRIGVFCVSWSRDGARITSGCSDGTLRVWDVEGGKTILEINTAISHIVAAIYSPDNTMIATGGIDDAKKEFLKIWDATTGKLVQNLKGHTDDVACLAWTPDGSKLISGSSDQSIRTWNTTTWQQIAIFMEHEGIITDIAISPNGRILASASEDYTARLWNLENDRLIGSPLQHPDFVNCLSFSTDGKLLATGCSDNAYTWDISAIDGIDQLLGIDKSILDAVATRRNQRRENAHRIPPRFFDDSPHYPHAPGIQRPSLPPERQHHTPGPTLLDHVASLFRRTQYNTHDTVARPRFPNSIRNPFSGVSFGGRDEDTELQDRHSAVAHVPFAHGNPRNYSAREARMKEEKAKNKKKQEEQRKKLEVEKSSVAETSEVAQTQPTSKLASSSITPAVAPAPASTILTSPRPVGRWTRFRLYICCLSGQYVDDHE